jgi:hypothetical protein
VKKCLYAKYYEDFTQFSVAISGCLEDANVKYKEELDSLLTLRFQRFDKSEIMNVSRIPNDVNCCVPILYPSTPLLFAF